MAYRPPDDSSPHAGYEGAIIEMLLQQHRAALTSTLVRATTGRVLLAALAVWAGATSSMSYTQGITTAAVALLFSGLWMLEARRQARQLAQLEEVISRRTGGQAEDLYIESRSYMYAHRRWAWMAARYEPLGWLYLVGAVVVAQLIVV